jgi:hypothetical protein
VAAVKVLIREWERQIMQDSPGLAEHRHKVTTELNSIKREAYGGASPEEINRGVYRVLGRTHYGPCKVFVAYKCKPARKEVSLQTGCRNKGLLSVSAYKQLATITYKHLATPHRRGRFYQILSGLPKVNGIGA